MTSKSHLIRAPAALRRRTHAATSAASVERRGLLRGEVVEHDHALARGEKRVDHMASDIAGAAGDQDRHELARL